MSCYIGKLYQNTSSEKNRFRSIGILMILSCSFWAAFFVTVNLILPSRALANLTYVLWGLANGTLHVFLLSIIDSMVPENYRFLIFAEMISEFRLSTFLLANMVSTIIRKFADIKSQSLVYTLKIVFLYLFLTCLIISVFFYRSHRNNFGIFIK